MITCPFDSSLISQRVLASQDNETLAQIGKLSVLLLPRKLSFWGNKGTTITRQFLFEDPSFYGSSATQQYYALHKQRVTQAQRWIGNPAISPFSSWARAQRYLSCWPPGLRPPKMVQGKRTLQWHCDLPRLCPYCHFRSVSLPAARQLKALLQQHERLELREYRCRIPAPLGMSRNGLTKDWFKLLRAMRSDDTHGWHRLLGSISQYTFDVEITEERRLRLIANRSILLVRRASARGFRKLPVRTDKRWSSYAHKPTLHLGRVVEADKQGLTAALDVLSSVLQFPMCLLAPEKAGAASLFSRVCDEQQFRMRVVTGLLRKGNEVSLEQESIIDE